MEKVKILDIDYYREKGREVSNTKGSDHYQKIREKDGIDAIEILIMNDKYDDFAIGNILKYALRYPETGNIKDLIKVIDYATIWAGLHLEREDK